MDFGRTKDIVHAATRITHLCLNESAYGQREARAIVWQHNVSNERKDTSSFHEISQRLCRYVGRRG